MKLSVFNYCHAFVYCSEGCYKFDLYEQSNKFFLNVYSCDEHGHLYDKSLCFNHAPILEFDFFKPYKYPIGSPENNIGDLFLNDYT